VVGNFYNLGSGKWRRNDRANAAINVAPRIEKFLREEDSRGVTVLLAGVQTDLSTLAVGTGLGSKGYSAIQLAELLGINATTDGDAPLRR